MNTRAPDQRSRPRLGESAFAVRPRVTELGNAVTDRGLGPRFSENATVPQVVPHLAGGDM